MIVSEPGFVPTPPLNQSWSSAFLAVLTEKESAQVPGISVATLKRDQEFAKAWLFELRDICATAHL